MEKPVPKRYEPGADTRFQGDSVATMEIDFYIVLFLSNIKLNKIT